MIKENRLTTFQSVLAKHADLAYIPFSADLQYLASIPRDAPSFGAILHPGAWLEGLWLTPGRDPVLMLTRMTAEFGGTVSDEVQVTILGDFDDPSRLVKGLLDTWLLPERPRLAVSDRALAETLVHLQRILPGVTFISATGLLRPQRRIKDQRELIQMRKAGEITETAFKSVLSSLKHGMTELEVVSEVDYQLRRNGAQGPSFPTSLYAVGSAHPLIFGDEVHSWPRSLNAPVSLMFDFGAIFEGLCYDYGRTVFFGEPDDQFRKVFELVMASQQAGIKALNAGSTTCADVDSAARGVIVEAGMGEAFRHRLGHGIGLDVHEPPFLTQGDPSLIQSGMLFTVEPSIIFPDRPSARVEDVILATDAGGVPLTSGFQELLVID